MLFIVIGAVMGFVLAITGAGGAIIGIPLLVHGMGLSLKAASVVALPIVGMAALFTLFFSYKKVVFRLLFYIFFPAFVFSFLTSLVKPHIPTEFILFSMVLLASYGLYQVWFRQNLQGAETTTHSAFYASMVGAVSGVVTSLTGLGGGVVLFPLLTRYLKLTDVQAIATSLAVIVMNVCFAFVFQYHSIGFSEFSINDVLFLMAGFLLSNGVAMVLFRRCSVVCQRVMVRFVYSFVLVFSIVILLV